MKVITGIYRGRKLVGPFSQITRPTLQRAKETIYNMMEHFFDGGQVLDVFAGSGQLGIEALSRGADYCFFNEINPQALQILKINLNKIKNYNISNYDFTCLLKKHKGQKFKLIFIDPPYSIAYKAWTMLLKQIDQYDLLAPEGYITGELPSKEKLKNNFISFKINKINKFTKLTTIWQYRGYK